MLSLRPVQETAADFLYERDRALMLAPVGSLESFEPGGGITVANCRPVIAAGADFLAVAGGVWNHKDGPEAAVRAFNEIFATQ